MGSSFKASSTSAFSFLYLFACNSSYSLSILHNPVISGKDSWGSSVFSWAWTVPWIETAGVFFAAFLPLPFWAFDALDAFETLEALDRFDVTDFPESGLFVFGILRPPDSEGAALDYLLFFFSSIYLILMLFFSDFFPTDILSAFLGNFTSLSCLAWVFFVETTNSTEFFNFLLLL